MRIARPYEWKELKEPRDAFDKVTTSHDRFFTKSDSTLESWPDDRKWQPRPFTQAELDDYFDRGGVVTLKHPDEARRTRLETRQTERKERGLGLPSNNAIGFMNLNLLRACRRRFSQSSSI